MYEEASDFQWQALATVARKNSNGKFTEKNVFPMIGHVMLSLLKLTLEAYSLYTIYHYMINILNPRFEPRASEFKPNRMARTVQNVVLFGKNNC